MTEAEGRARVVAEALSWAGTPYMPSGRVKGKNGGCDCLTFLAGVYENAGIINPLPIPHYNRDWFKHNDFEFYLLGKDDTPGVLYFCDEIFKDPQPGDVALWKFGLCFSHAAVVVNWPRIVHSFCERPVGPDNGNRTALKTVHEIIELRGTPRPRRFFTVKNWGK
jgi:cell wall-associated NlpC family hydrolase